MTPEEKKRAQEICSKATGGNWTWEHDTHVKPDTHTVYAGRDPGMHGLNLFGRLDVDWNGENNLNFICETRALLPKALDHIETLETEVERLRKIEALYNARNRKGAPKP